MPEPSKLEPKYLLIGRIQKPHGVRGEVRVEVMTESPSRFRQMDQILMSRREKSSPKPIVVEGVRFHQGKALLKLEGINNRDEAGELRGYFLWIPVEDAIPLEDGEFYLYELVGMQVWSDEGELLGSIKDTLQTGANEVFVVNGGERGELLIPDTEEVVLDISRVERKVTVHLIPGLI